MISSQALFRPRQDLGPSFAAWFPDLRRSGVYLMSNVIIHRHAAKYLYCLPKETKDRIKGILKQLENNPLTQSGIKQDVW